MHRLPADRAVILKHPVKYWKSRTGFPPEFHKYTVSVFDVYGSSDQYLLVTHTHTFTILPNIWITETKISHNVAYIFGAYMYVQIIDA